MSVAQIAVFVVIVILPGGIALMARRRSSIGITEFQLAGRQFGVITNACAICGDYVSAASFLGVAAVVYMVGLDGAWLAAGFTAGFIPVLLFVAAPLRRFGDRSIPDFLARRFRSERVRLVTFGATEVIILAYLVPQSVGGGLAWSLLTDMKLPGMSGYSTGVVLSTFLTAVLVVVGGMRGTTWNQALQFITLLGVLLWLALALSASGFSYAETLGTVDGQALTKPVQDGVDVTLQPVPDKVNGGDARFASPGARYSALELLSLIATLISGTSGLPHVMNRFFTSPTGRSARMTTVGVIVLIGFFYILAVLMGTAARYVVQRRAGTDAWLDGLSVDGVLRIPEHAMLVLGWVYGGEIGFSIVAGGALLALTSTSCGLLLAASASVGHDIYERYLNPKASRSQALMAGRLTVIGFALLAALIASLAGPAVLGNSVPSVVASLVTAAFALAGCTITPALILGIWWKRTTATGVVAGVGCGMILCLVSLGVGFATAEPLLLTPTLFLGPFVAFLIILVSLLTDPVAEIDVIWVRLHGTSQDRETQRLASTMNSSRPQQGPFRRRPHRGAR